MPLVSFRSLRLLLVVLLAVGTLVRPMLIVSCEIHAISHAHAAQPHMHGHDLPDDAGSPDGDGHGEHELLNHVAFAGVADTVAPLLIPEVAPVRQAMPGVAPMPRLVHHAGAPFRPPIV